MADFDAEPLKPSGLWEDDPALPAFPHHQCGQMGKPVVLHCLRQQPTGQLSGRVLAKRAEPKTVLQFRCMTPAVLLRRQIVIHGRWRNIDPLGDKRNESSRGPFSGVQGTPRVTQVAKHQRVAETVVIATASLNQRHVCIG